MVPRPSRLGFQAVFLLLLLPLAASVRGEVIIDSLSAAGQLEFTAPANAAELRVQRAAAVTGPWTNHAAAVGSAATVSASGFYRVAATLPANADAFSRLEGEGYSAMSGIQLEPGGTAIGYYDDGDWLRFDAVDFGAGAASLALSVAKESGSGTVELRLDAVDGTLIGTFTPSLTGGWSAYETQEIDVDAVAGIHDLYLVAVGSPGVCNLDWFRFSTNALTEPDYALVWEDDFTGTALDGSKWYAVQHGFVDNNEQQFYTDRPENVAVSNGFLWLTARRETYVGTGPWMGGQNKTSEYTSGKIESLGKAQFQYGRFEARMKLPRGEGTWPAFWMLGSNLFEPDVGWPRCGEIDIMEHGGIQDVYTGALHTEAYNHTLGTQKVMGQPITTYDTQFHVYGVDWTPDHFAFHLDGQVFYTVTKAEMGSSQAEWPFDQPFWLILNLAVGGPYGGDPAPGVYPYQMQVDWVRVYEEQP